MKRDANCIKQCPLLDRFQEISDNPSCQSSVFQSRFVTSSDENHRLAQLHFTKASEQFESVDAREMYVGNDAVGLCCRERVEEGGSRRIGFDLEARKLEKTRQRLLDLNLVVYDCDQQATPPHRIMTAGLLNGYKTLVLCSSLSTAGTYYAELVDSASAHR